MMEKKKNKMRGMVDISTKEVTKRVARAASTIQMTPKAFDALIHEGSPKGDVFETAKVAAVMAAKSTPSIIPLCHPLMLSKVNVTFSIDKRRKQIVTISEVVCRGQTGVEMEALTAASVASLTIYDMMKWAGKGCVILETKLLHKSGGESGDYDA
jgi:cyclic pyranopterin monophosphate synthase